MNYSDVKTWIPTANLDEQIGAAKLLLTQIASGPPQHRDRFFNEVKNDPTVSRLFEKTTV